MIITFFVNMIARCLYILILIVCFNLSLIAQEKGKFHKNLQIKGKNTQKKVLVKPPVNPEKKTTNSQQYQFDPQKEHSIVEEDTTMLDDGGEPELVEIREEVLVDSVYLTAATYYAYWDTYNIDPYKKNPREFKDTVKLRLYDEKHSWAFPLTKSYVTSPFAYRWYRFHYGTDLALNTGDSVKAAFDGIVRIVRWDGYGFGNYVLIRHDNGLETLYGHLSKQLVTVRQKVKAGDLIGLGGSTGRSSGPHLHYETRYQGDPFNPGFIYDFANGGHLKDENFTLTKEHFSYFSGIGNLQNSYMFRQAVYHRIKNGETLGHIARKYRSGVSYICRLNGITPRTLLRAGRTIRVR